MRRARSRHTLVLIERGLKRRCRYRTLQERNDLMANRAETVQSILERRLLGLPASVRKTELGRLYGTSILVGLTAEVLQQRGLDRAASDVGYKPPTSTDLTRAEVVHADDSDGFGNLTLSDRQVLAPAA